ncbi:mechanosensitive channel of small conductance (MscS1C) [Vairimorpha necatrix]|uniref:Mechanosensitive channel of small conductance (MscS1C) n=1 Tax=Vairimorpha necatrix TaxID=6039 RepID=A0AAX4JFN7_9MICR
MCVIELKMFFSHYKNRLALNQENTQVIELLNRRTGIQMFSNLQTWGHYVFKTVSPDTDQLTFKECEEKFGTIATKRIYKLFDANKDLTITAAEFVTVYHGVIQELGLLYSSYLVDNLLTFIQNSQIMTENIVNYRFCEVESKTFFFKFNIESFKKNYDILNKRIKKIVRSSNQVYTGKYDILNFEMLTDEIITVEITVYFKINFQYIKGLVKNEDAFLIELYDLFRDLEIKLY